MTAKRPCATWIEKCERKIVKPLPQCKEGKRNEMVFTRTSSATHRFPGRCVEKNWSREMHALRSFMGIRKAFCGERGWDLIYLSHAQCLVLDVYSPPHSRSRSSRELGNNSCRLRRRAAACRGAAVSSHRDSPHSHALRGIVPSV